MEARYRYRRWDGTQEFDPFTASDLMDELADRMLDEGDLWSAMRDMIQRGTNLRDGRRMSGLRDLLGRLREKRQQWLQRYNLNSLMDDLKDKLEQVVQAERGGIQERLSNQDQSSEEQLRKMLENMARKHLDQLDHMPDQVGGRIQALRDYEFMDQQARQQFDELLESLKEQMLQNYFQGLKQGIGAMTPELMAQAQEMLRDLNDLLARHRRGDDSGFQQFMERWRQFFPDDIENVEQLAEYMQRQMAQMQSLLNSMTPDMRQELEDMLAPLFQNPELQREMAELMANLDRLFPDARGEPFPFSGDDPVTLQEAMRLMGDMNSLDQLERELFEAARSNDPSGLDADEIGRLVGDEARKMAEELRDFARMLEEAGLIRRKGKEWELTPRAMRKIGERALEDIFGRIDRGLAGDHSLARFGWGIERLDDTKTYTFGDAFTLDAQQSVMNALRHHGPSRPLRMAEEDFEVYRSSSINQCSTVIMLDMSYSMLMAGRFQAGRKVTLALDSLIRSKFPRDSLQVVAFSYFVLPLEPHMLLDSYWVDPRGTDFPEAFRQARALLGKHKGGTKQIIMITDGEPHANSGGWGAGEPWSYRQAMADTFREVTRCTREDITVNIFMMDRDPGLTAFVKTMAKINRGRTFYVNPNRLGEYVIVDYVKNRRRAG